MLFSTTLMKRAGVPFLLSLSLVAAAPTSKLRRVGSGIDVLLFDAPAVINNGATQASIEAFAFATGSDTDTSALEKKLKPILSPLALFGVDVDSALETALERTKLFVAVPEGNAKLTVNVKGCSGKAVLKGTDTNGLAFQDVDVGDCSGGDAGFAGTLEGVDESTSMTVFPSEDGGFGVISDIDDTTKISNVLDKLKLAKATLFDSPTPVPGMPELYANLSQSLNNPSFTYITGSPYQLVPFLRDFIHTTYSATPGAILAKNLTVSNLDSLGDFLFDKNSTFDHKLRQIERVHELWPNKKFLAIGDSGEKDPETYGEAFRTHGGDVIQCIWIRRVDGADNNDERFAAAFDGVPQDRVRVYEDSDITDVLPGIDVAGGKC